MITNKQEKKNWNEDDITILIWVVDKYCKFNQIKIKNLVPICRDAGKLGARPAATAPRHEPWQDSAAAQRHIRSASQLGRPVA